MTYISIFTKTHGQANCQKSAKTEEPGSQNASRGAAPYDGDNDHCDDHCHNGAEYMFS